MESCCSNSARGFAVTARVASRRSILALQSRHRRKTLSVDPDLLKTVAATFDIEIRGRGGANGLGYEAALGQLLEHLAQGRSLPMPQTTLVKCQLHRPL